MNDKSNDSLSQTQILARAEPGQDAIEGQLARVVVIRGPELGDQFIIGDEPLVIGRASECELDLSGNGISRRHCRIEQADGQYWIEDLGSTNHTHINEAVVDRQALVDGDRIRVGQTVLKFIGPDNPEAALLEKMAGKDGLDQETGLFNRHHFQADLEAAVERASADPEESGGGVIYLTLDKLSHIRDQVGMTGLDRLIGKIGRVVVDQLDEAHRPARLGEYSLVVLATGLKADQMAHLADQLRDRISSTAFDLDAQEVAVSMSLGLCPFSLRISDADTMLVCAARAAEQAQSGGGNRIKLYEPEVLAAGAAADDRTMLGLLREALKKDLLQTLFQPAVSTGDDELTHYQLLPRLLTDDNQLIAAAEFIPVAASHGEIQRLDRWMSTRAIAIIREQQARGNRLRLFISQSADSLRLRLMPDRRHRLLVFEFQQADLNAHLKVTWTVSGFLVPATKPSPAVCGRPRATVATVQPIRASSGEFCCSYQSENEIVCCPR